MKVSPCVWACLSGILLHWGKASPILPPTSFTPGMFSDWWEGTKPCSRQQIDVVTVLSASHVAVRQFAAVRMKKKLWHMDSQAWDYAEIHREWPQNAWEWGDPHMREHWRLPFLKCPCVALSQAPCRITAIWLCLCPQIWEDSAL